MILFKLNPNNFKPNHNQCDILKIDLGNMIEHMGKIKMSIDFFNEEIIWDNMFNIEDAKKRIQNGIELYLGMVENLPFGHVWFRDYKDGKILYNVFVRNKVKFKKHTGTEFVSYIIENFYKKTNIYCEVDEWNEKSLKMFEKLGFERL